MSLILSYGVWLGHSAPFKAIPRFHGTAEIHWPRWADKRLKSKFLMIDWFWKYKHHIINYHVISEMWSLHIKSFQGFHLYPIVQSSTLMESHVPFVCVIMFLPGVLPKCEWTSWSIVAGQKSFSQLPSFSCQPATSDPCENKLIQNYSLCTKN